MTEIDLFSAKNNSLTCRINNILMHSAYNPENEAKNFVESIQISFKPDYFFIIEPGINYIHSVIKQKFPECKICILRFSKNFDNYNYDADKVFYLSDDFQTNNFEMELNNYFHDEGILHTQFVQWQPSCKIYIPQTDFAWKTIKKFIQYSQTILNTNGFFAKRWLKNSVSFFKFANNFSTINKGHSDIIVTASGISLITSLNKIKEIRNHVFLISVSSSLKPLIYAGIEPDLVISTDGGFWAKKHLSALLNSTLPIALSPESNCPKTVLKKNPVIPLYYSDGTSSKLLKKYIDDAILAERNGTVSGTAIELALTLTDGNVYVCGLDLSGNPSFQHTNPNEIERCNSNFDNKIKTSESRQTASRFNSGSLKIYENWFSANSKKFNNRVMRVSNNFNYANKLGEIKDLDFSEICIKQNMQKPEISISTSPEIKIETIKKEFLEYAENDDFIKECFPVECLTASRTIDSSEKQNIKNKLKADTMKLIENLFQD